jgi:acyl carrier protein
VIVREDNTGDRRLVAYYVPENSGSTLPVSELKTSLQKSLPEYMVPSAFVSIDRMPRIPSGKLDRRALPSPDLMATSSKSEIVLPQTPEENKMSEIWAEVLKLKQVGITDNLFELGADSLHVFQIVARANKVGIKVTAKLILQHKNIQAIVKELSNSNDNGNGSAAAPSSITAVSRHKYRVRNTIA